jgi:hypothetical protein
MNPEEAYDAIRRVISADPQKRIVDSSFDAMSFGNFWVTFDDNGQRKSIVNDRGELVLDGQTAMLSMYEVDEPTIMRALRL